MSAGISRVFICGAHSTGKTTLLHRLMMEPEITKLSSETEVAREIIADLGWKREHFEPKVRPDNFYKLQLKILQAQCQMDSTNCKLNQSYISDRGIDPLIYCKMYLGDDMFNKLLNTKEATECIKRQKYLKTVTVVLKPHPECVKDDGTRLSPLIDELNNFTELIVKFFKTYNISYTIISELDLEKRVTILKSLVKGKNID